VQRLDADNHGAESRGNLRVAHVADVVDALDLEVVNLGVKGALTCDALPLKRIDMRSLVT